jgi:cell division protein FtsW
MHRNSVDHIFLILVISLLLAGFFIFLSASFGALDRNAGKFDNLLFSQIILGFMGGGIAMYITSSLIKYNLLRNYAFWIFIGSAILALFVFVPGIGMEHGGAKRWIDVGITTFQPGEILKFGIVVYLAAWFTVFKRKIHSPYFGIYPMLAIIGVAAGLLLAQPDFGTFAIAATAGVAMYITAGAGFRDLSVLLVVGIVMILGMALWKPYFIDRISTFLIHDDFQGSGYQVRQSLIAIGSGEVWGRGFGQSVQKFHYLPESHGDSIFAVATEEFGFVGATILILLYVAFALRGLWIASKAPDNFGKFLAVGLVTLITSQSFLNIGSMLNLVPLTGVPLVFISHGGTALAVAMAEVGILLNISRHRLR